ncbi:MAG: hypothetical protein ACQEXV_23490 [Bacillota bacterium]
MEREQVIHDLTMLYLEKSGTITELSEPEDYSKVYQEIYSRIEESFSTKSMFGFGGINM